MGETPKARDRRRRARNRRFAGKAAFTGINWAHYKHHELYDMIHDAEPGMMSQRAQQWKTLGDAINTTTKDVQRTVDQLLQTWRGTAANSAKASNDQLHDWATEASSAATGIGGSLETYATAVSEAQRKMPPPEFAYSEQAAMTGHDFKQVTGESREIQLAQMNDDQKPNFEKNRAAHAEAIRVMTTYGGQSQVVHDDMPPLPPSPPGRGAPPAVTYDEVQGGPSPGPGPGPRPGPGSEYPGPGPTGSDGVPPGTTTAAGFADPTAARAGSGAPGLGGTGLGGTGTGAGYGGGVGSLGSGGSDIARPGAGGFAGAGGMAGRPGGAPGMGALGARGAGAGMFGGMPMGAGGAPGEEDQEHKNKYDEGLDLFDDLPPAYPPVFGA